MYKHSVLVPSTSNTTINEYSPSDTDEQDIIESGLDAKCVAAVKHAFRSSYHQPNTSLTSPNKKSSTKCKSKTGVIVPCSQKRKASFEDEDNGPPQIDIIRASILEFFFSTFPLSEQDGIRTGFTHILITAGISSPIVFSKAYKQIRIKNVRMMYDQFARSTLANKMSDPRIDNRLTFEFPPIITYTLTRYNEDFEEIKEIGSGGFGKVYQAKSRIDGQFYAIKKIPLRRATDKTYKKILDECVFHASLHHPNIVRYHNAWVDQSYQDDFQPPSPVPQTVKIRSLSTSLDDIPSTTSNASSTVAFANEEDEDKDDEKDNHNLNDKSESSSISSDESKGKGFWAKKQAGEVGDVSFGSDDESENNEEGEEENHSEDDESSLSDASMDSREAKKKAKILAKIDYDDVLPKNLHLAIDKINNIYCDEIGYPTLFIQMELCHTTLEKYIRHRECSQIDPLFNGLVFECLLSAVEFLHGHSVVHRDIKPSNIFIKKFSDKNPVIMLGDFGLARRKDVAALPDLPSTPSPVEQKLTSGLGTYLYAAPEQLDSVSYSFPADIYSVGVVIYELYHLFRTGSERIVILVELRKTSKLSIEFQNKWPELSPILSSMIEKEPKKRLEASVHLSKLKKIRESRSNQTEIQRLTIENQRLQHEADLWKRKYLDLRRKLRPHRGHGDSHDNEEHHVF